MKNFLNSPLIKFFKRLFHLAKGEQPSWIEATPTVLKIQNIPSIINHLQRMVEIRDVVFAEFVLYNIEVLERYFNSVNQKIVDMIPNAYNEYRKKEQEIMDKYQNWSKDGKTCSIIVDGKKEIVKRYKVDDLIKNLKEEYKDAISEKELAIEKGKALTEGEVTLNVFVLPRPALPKEISAKDIRILDALIEPIKID